jgi:hypothetical protein
MNPESGLLIRVAAQSVIKSGFSTLRPESGFEFIDNIVTRKNDMCPGAIAGIKNIPAVWS